MAGFLTIWKCSMWQQGYQIVAVSHHSVLRTSATVEMGSRPSGRAGPGERGEEDNRGEAGVGTGREGGPGAGGEGFKWRDRQKLITGDSWGGRIKWVFPSAQSQGYRGVGCAPSST